MNARLLAPVVALSTAFVVGCGSARPVATGEPVAGPASPTAAPSRSARDGRARVAPERVAAGDRVVPGDRLAGDDVGPAYDAAEVRPEVRAVRDRLVAQYDAFGAGPAGAQAPRRPPARPPVYSNLNDRTVDETPEPLPPTAQSPTAGAAAPSRRAGVRRPPSASPLPTRDGEPAATPAAPVGRASIQAQAVVPAPAAAAVPADVPPAVPPAAAAPAVGPGKAEVAVGGAPGAAVPADDVRLRAAGNPPVDVQVYGATDDDLARRVTRRLKDGPQDLSAHADYLLYHLLKSDAAGAPMAPAGLTKDDRALLTAFVDGVANVRTAFGADASPLLSDRVRPVVEMADRMRALADMSIPVVELCSKVGGFGVYEPLTRRFKAGADHPVIVYCEVQNFTSRPTLAQFWETKLSLEVTLSTNDGTVIWNDKNNVPVDVSRNRRHDFFLIKHMLLPKTLGLGKYLLKVSVTDENAKRVAEYNSDITMAAQ
jgi:hypothetical protein